MKLPSNIEKSGFHRGQYVGYGGGLIWRIRKTRTGWEMTRHCYPRNDKEKIAGTYHHARTLHDASKILDKLDAKLGNAGIASGWLGLCS